MKIAHAALAASLLTAAAAAPAAAAVIGYNFGTASPYEATPTSGTATDFSAGAVSVANSFGTVTPLSATSPSSGYTGASGGGNVGVAVNYGALSTSASSYYSVTFTPAAGYKLLVTDLDFGTRSTTTGPVAYAVRSSVDNFAADLASGTIANNSTWALKDNTFEPLTGADEAAVELRIYVYGEKGTRTSNPVSGTINSRVDDLSVAVSAAAVPEPTAMGVLSALGVFGMLRRRR